MFGPQAGIIDLDYGNLETVHLQEFNILLGNTPAILDFTGRDVAAHTRRGATRYKTYLSEAFKALIKCNKDVLYEFRKEEKFIYNLEAQACKQNSWAFIFYAPASLVLIDGNGCFYALPIPMPIHDEILFPLAGTWAGKNIVIFYKNLVDESLHIAVFELNIVSDTPTLRIIQDVKTQLKIRYKRLIPVYAYYFDIKHKDLEGIFLLKFPEHKNLFIVTSNFKICKKISARALVATKNLITRLTSDDIFCIKPDWFVERLQEDREDQQFYIVNSDWNGMTARPGVKLLTFPEHKHFTPKLAVYGDDTYLIKSCRCSYHSCAARLDHSFAIKLNEYNKKFTVYKRNLQSVVEKFIEPKGSTPQVNILPRNIQLYPPNWVCNCTSINTYFTKIRYFLKMDVVVGWD